MGLGKRERTGMRNHCEYRDRQKSIFLERTNAIDHGSKHYSVSRPESKTEYTMSLIMMSATLQNII